jgi:hypothetical protein
MKNIKILLIIIFSIFSISLLLPIASTAVAAVELPGLKEAGKEIGYKNTETSKIGIIIGKIIQAILGFVGVIFMVLILMGAFDIQGAGGNEEAVKKGKDKIKNGAIGLAIIFSAYIISYVFLGWLAGGELKIFNIN